MCKRCSLIELSNTITDNALITVDWEYPYTEKIIRRDNVSEFFGISKCIRIFMNQNYTDYIGKWYQFLVNFHLVSPSRVLSSSLRGEKNASIMATVSELMGLWIGVPPGIVTGPS